MSASAFCLPRWVFKGSSCSGGNKLMRGRARTEKSVFYSLLWMAVANRLNIGKFTQFP